MPPQVFQMMHRVLAKDMRDESSPRPFAGLPFPYDKLRESDTLEGWEGTGQVGLDDAKLKFQIPEKIIESAEAGG